MPTPGTSLASLSRRERERLRRRQDILDAARAVFAEKGYAHATVDEIAHRAEFGKGTLYNYFEGGKDSILLAVFDEIYDDICGLIQQLFTPERIVDHTVREAFHAFVVAYMDYFLERQELFMIIAKEVSRMVFSDDPEKARYFQQQRTRVVDALIPALEEGIRRGELRSLPAHAVAHMLIGNINGLQMHQCLEQTEDLAEDSILRSSTAAADFLTGMLFDGLSCLARSADA